MAANICRIERHKADRRYASQQFRLMHRLRVQAYETLSVLEGTSNMAESALRSGTKLKPEDVKNLSFYFNKVCTGAPSAWGSLCHSLAVCPSRKQDMFQHNKGQHILMYGAAGAL